jgi:hypothetical protein
MYIPTLSLTSALKWGGLTKPRPSHFILGKDPVPILKEAGWAPGPVWTGVKDLAPAGVRSHDHLARSESIYRLSYRVPKSRCYSPYTAVQNRHCVATGNWHHRALGSAGRLKSLPSAAYELSLTNMHYGTEQHSYHHMC